MKSDLNKIKGSLYGFAIGDAMGATTEFMDKRKIKSKYGIVDTIIGGGWLNIKPGNVTDDTEMMLCVADASFTNRYYQNCCINFINWFLSKPIDIGNTCARVIGEMAHRSEANPTVWFEQSKKAQARVPAYGNGGLMRCLVPCLMEEPKRAVVQSSLTHNNQLCEDAVVSYYRAIRKSLAGLKPTSEVYWMSPEGHVTNTLNNALYWFKTSTNFKEAIIGPVNDGGDADTIAAITGGLAGAFYGFEAIPTEWVEKLSLGVREELDKCAEKIVGGANEKLAGNM